MEYRWVNDRDYLDPTRLNVSRRWCLLDASPYEGTEYLPSMPDIEQLIDSHKASVTSFAVEPGDILAFDAKIIHMPKGNLNFSRLPLRRIALRLGGDDAVY